MSEKFSYEKSMNELNTILTEIDDMDIPIDKLVNKVSKGAEILVKCKKKLTETEAKVNEILSELDKEFQEEDD